MQVINKDSYPLYMKTGLRVHDENLATAMLAEASKANPGEVHDKCLYYKALSEAADSYDVETAGTKVWNWWYQSFLSYTLNPNQAKHTFRTMSALYRHYGNVDEGTFVLWVVPYYNAKVDKSEYHKLESCEQEGVIIIAGEPGYSPEGIWGSDDLSCAIVGDSLDALTQYINIANHLNRAAHEED